MTDGQIEINLYMHIQLAGGQIGTDRVTQSKKQAVTQSVHLSYWPTDWHEDSHRHTYLEPGLAYVHADIFTRSNGLVDRSHTCPQGSGKPTRLERAGGEKRIESETTYVDDWLIDHWIRWFTGKR